MQCGGGDCDCRGWPLCKGDKSMTSENVVAQQVEVDLWFGARGRAGSVGVAPDWGVDSSTLIQEVKLRELMAVYTAIQLLFMRNVV